MQKRSLLKIFFYNIFTLGVYELVWLHQTRRELTRFSTVRIPSVGPLVLLNLLQFTGIILAVVLTFMSNDAEKATPVSPSCSSSYAIATLPESMAKATVSSACREQIKRSTAASTREDRLVKGYLIVIGLLVVSRLGYPRWLRNYALAVQQVSRGKLSQTATMAKLVFAQYGMVAVQDVFNNMVPLNAAALPEPVAYQSTENKTAHRVLSTIVIRLVVLFGIGIVFLIIVSYYGTH